MLVERIVAFVRGESAESFAELALELFRLEYGRGGAFRDLCDQRGATPETVADWRRVPALPATAAAASEVDPAPEQARLKLRRSAVDRSFPAACLAGLDRPPILSLLPTDDTARQPQLALLAGRVLETWAASDSVAALARRGVEAARARSFLGARQRDRRPLVILATPDSLARLLEALERRGLRFRLPPGSRVVEAAGGGDSDPQLLERLAIGLAVPPEACVRVYAAPGMVTPLYAGRSADGQLQPFTAPPWTRPRVLDPQTGAEAAAGTEGRLAVFDLAALGSVFHLLTDTRAMADEDGLRLAGG